MANWYDLKSQPPATSGLNFGAKEPHQFLDQKISTRQQQQRPHHHYHHHHHHHHVSNMRMSIPPPMNAIDALVRATAERQNYLLTANISPNQMPRLPAPPTNSSLFFNKTLSLLHSHAQSSRLCNVANVTTITSRALESERKKKLMMQKRNVLPFIAGSSNSSKGERAINPSEPTDNDVLLGRGGRSNHHVGNERYRELIRNNRGRYNGLPKHEKIKLSRAIVAVIHELGGRFVEPNPNYNKLQPTGEDIWHVVGTKKAVEKTSQCLREKRSGDKEGAKVSIAQAIAGMRNQQIGTTSKAA